MYRQQLVCAIGVILSSVVLAGNQAAAPAALPNELRAQVQNGTFGLVTSVRGLPLGVRDAMQALFGTGGLEIAEPGAEFQQTDVITTPGLYLRRMVAAGCTARYCLVYYERGGFVHTWHVLLFRWTPEATRFEWGGAAPGGLRNIDEVRKAVLSGAIKDGAGRY